MTSRILFENVSGIVFPIFADGANGQPVVADGVKILSGEDACKLLGVSEAAIEEVYNTFMRRVLAGYEPNVLAQRNALRKRFENLTDDEFELLLANCNRRGIDPASRQVWFKEQVNRFTGQREVILTLTVDGFYALANTSPEIESVVGPQWCGDDMTWNGVWVGEGLPVAARTLVKRRDKTAPFEHISHMADNADLMDPNGFDMPIHMLGKRSACGAIRRALAERLDGVFSADELRAETAKRPPVAVQSQYGRPAAAQFNGRDISNSQEFDRILIDLGIGNAKARDAFLDEMAEKFILVKASGGLLRWRLACCQEAEKRLRESADGFVEPTRVVEMA